MESNRQEARRWGITKIVLGPSHTEDDVKECKIKKP